MNQNEVGLEKVEGPSKQLLAIIVRANFSKPGVSFITDNSQSIQMGALNHSKGKIIQPHSHNTVKREVFNTQEVLFIRSGKLRVDFYVGDKKYFGSKVLHSGDTILLVSEGHGFEVLENVDIIEIKQGPYVEAVDKVKFEMPESFFVKMI